jgi:hypothetical protein
LHPTDDMFMGLLRLSWHWEYRLVGNPDKVATRPILPYRAIYRGVVTI